MIRMAALQANDMIYPGSDLKFQITSTQPGFHLTEDDFTIVIRDQYGRKRQVIHKNDCFYDSDGRFYFTVEDVRRGVYYAFFDGSYEDDDYPKQRRVFTDAQELYRVDYCGCPCRREHEHTVKYEQVWTVSLDDDTYLTDANGQYILTSEGKRIVFRNLNGGTASNTGKVRMSMTGEEFLRKWEGYNPNGAIDTVPEMMDAMRNQDDDGTTQLGNLTDEEMEGWFRDGPADEDPEEPDEGAEHGE